MRHIINISLILISLNSFGQIICPCDSFDFFWGGDTINVIQDNKKQGFWIHYDRLLHSIDGLECRGGTAILDYKTISKGFYHDNKKIGNWTSYHNDTLISRYVKYSLGTPDSVDTSFDIKGNVLSRTFWDKGKRDSVIVYYETGKLKYKGKYHLDQLTEFKIFYPDGKLKYAADMTSGLVANELKFYDQSGKQNIPRDNDISTIGLIEELIKYMD